MLRANVILHDIDLEDYDVFEIPIVGKPKRYYDISDTTKVTILDKEDIENNAIIDSSKNVLYYMKHKAYASKL